ncbi:MAG: SPOR domain-containing protein [Bacteroidaceae bacterium]|nr:SPOR domain-containing protein [Bacteroidaceae bacterium]
MRKYFVLGMSFCVALAFTSCKSSESAYKKAYEKAKQQEATEAQSEEQPVSVAPVITTPVTTTVVPVTENVAVRSEKVQLVDGNNLQDYNVVVGSFGLKANADGLRQTLINKGYNAIIVSATTAKGLMYRVIAATYADKASAAQAKANLQSTYPDAWLLYRTY